MNRAGIVFSSKYYQHDQGADRPGSAKDPQTIINARLTPRYYQVYEIIVDSTSM